MTQTIREILKVSGFEYEYEYSGPPFMQPTLGNVNCGRIGRVAAGESGPIWKGGLLTNMLK